MKKINVQCDLTIENGEHNIRVVNQNEVLKVLCSDEWSFHFFIQTRPKIKRSLKGVVNLNKTMLQVGVPLQVFVKEKLWLELGINKKPYVHLKGFGSLLVRDFLKAVPNHK
jgi:hypothetical protein